MKKISDKKFSFIIVLTAIFAVFAILTSLSAFGNDSNERRGVVFAEESEESITLLETKAKKSLDEKYLLLITGFDTTNLKKDGLYYIGYKYTVKTSEKDTAREMGAQAAKYYNSVTLKTDPEDETKTQVVTPTMIYGESYASYGLIVYEIEFDTSFSEDIADYSNIYAYIDEMEKNEETGEYDIVASSENPSFTYSDRDTYFPVNNDFETGDPTGWTVSNNVENKSIGGVISKGSYWRERIPFNQSGTYLFGAYTRTVDDYAEGGDEDATGTLTSTKFTLGGSGWITFKLGGGKHYEQVYFEVVEYGTDKVLARYYNSEWTDSGNQGCALNQYRANLSNCVGKAVYIRITDNATADYGLFFVDDIITYYSSAPTIGVEAENLIGNVNVLNGSFDKNFNGWIVEGDIGEITEAETFWENPACQINNTGKYFRGDLSGKEERTGTLTSADFLISGSGFITFKLGAAGNENCYITLDKKTDDGYETVALWHNDEWVDGAENAEQPGYGLRMVEYKADLSDHLGETARIVLHDEATSGFGFFTFDELKTYYATEPSGTSLVNQLTVRADLLSALASDNIDEQGDYTSESYDNYVAKKNTATNLSVHSKVAAINSAMSEYLSAKNALAVRVPEEVEGAVKTQRLYAEGSVDLTISDYVDANSLSGITYEVVSSDNNVVTVGAVENGSVTLTAANIATETEVTVTINVKYYGVTKLSVNIAITVTKDVTPSLVKNSVELYLDLYELDNKTDIEINFASNVSNLGGLALTYSVTENGNAVVLNDNAYTFTYGSYTYEYTDVVFAVTVSYTANGAAGALNYNYTLHIKNTTAYRIENGGFENGLTGWTISDSEHPFGHVTEASEWFDNITYNKDGNYLFSGIEDYVNGKVGNGLEGNVGTLTSESFIIGGTGYMSFKLGGGNAYCYVSVVEVSTGNVLAKYYNGNRSANPGTMIQYYVDLSAHLGKTVYIQVVDNATNDWGCIAFDSMVVYYGASDDIPEGAIYCENIIYQVVNGSFEIGLSGWTMTLTENGEHGTLGRVVNTEIPKDWYQVNNSRKDGNNLFTFYFYDGDRRLNAENSKGSLRSSEFILKANGIISFRFGAAHNDNVYVKICKADGTPLAVFRNSEKNNVGATEMVYYRYQFDNAEEMTCYFEIVDDAVNNYGCFVVDDFRVNLDALPVGAVDAVDVKSQI
ncbi:MAG: hypothetical protein IJ800_00370 [Clostridia bacterium]|nr:hypothetical protein [Clostridia bacterium]